MISWENAWLRAVGSWGCRGRRGVAESQGAGRGGRAVAGQRLLCVACGQWRWFAGGRCALSGSLLEHTSVRRAAHSTLCGLLSSQGGQQSWQARLRQRLNPHRPARASATAMAAETCQCCAALGSAVSVECPSQRPSPWRLSFGHPPCLQLLPPQPASEGCGAQRANL